jgi:tRNA(Ile)-lysidine synthase
LPRFGHKNGVILRPLLHWRRGDLVHFALENDLPFVDDPSNSDNRFDRARLRHALQSQTALDPAAVQRGRRRGLPRQTRRLIGRWSG